MTRKAHAAEKIDRRPGAEFAGFIADIFAPLGPVMLGRMFSGHGFKLDGVQFAMILRDTLYLRADDSLAAELKTLGSKPFKYTTSIRTVTVASYWSVPEESFDDADQMVAWARRAVIAAHTKPKKKKPAKPKTASAKGKKR